MSTLEAIFFINAASHSLQISWIMTRLVFIYVLIKHKENKIKETVCLFMQLINQYGNKIWHDFYFLNVQTMHYS